MSRSGEEQKAGSEGGNGSNGSGAPEVVGVRRGMFGAKGSGDTSGYGGLVRPVELPGSSPRPYGGYFDDVVDKLAGVLGEDNYAESIERVVVFRDELTLEVELGRMSARAGKGTGRALLGGPDGPVAVGCELLFVVVDA